MASDVGTETPLPSPRMDSVNRRAKLHVGQGVARAYGLKRPDDGHDDLCVECDGDGCVWCHHTGTAPA